MISSLALAISLAGGLVDDVGRERAAQDVLVGHGDLLDAAVDQFAHVARGDALVAGGDDLAVLAGDVEARHLALQAFRDEIELGALDAQVERVEDEELLQDVLVGQADGLEQRRHRHLAAAVDAEEQEVLRVEFEVEPRAAVGNHAGREQELAGAVRLAAVMLEEHAGRAVQLRDDHALRAVDDERAVLGHERDLAHVDLLLLHLLHGVLRRFLVHDDEADLGAQRGAEREAALLAFDDVERRRQQREAHELEPGVARVARDREDRRERGLQALVLALVSLREFLQERAIGRELRFEEERHLQDACALGEALADAFLFGKGIGRSVRGRHVSSSRLQFDRARAKVRGPQLTLRTPREGARMCLVSELPTCQLPTLLLRLSGALHPWPGGWPLPAAGGRHSLAETPDQTCFLQSIQKAKQNGHRRPALLRPLTVKAPGNHSAGLPALTGNRRAPPAISPISFRQA